MTRDPISTYRLLVRRALANEDFSNFQLHFEAAVLDRYRGAPGFSVIRTDTVGRVRQQGGWSLDFGIAEDDTLIHISQVDVAKLPKEDREHWATHAVCSEVLEHLDDP